MITYLIICPLVFLAGFVDSIAGGGGLISLPAYMLAGLPAQNAVATNKLSACMGTFISSGYYFKKGFMKASLCIPGIIAALIGSWLGANLNLLLSEHILKIIMLFVLPAVAIYVLRNEALTHPAESAFSFKKTAFLCALISFAVGIYDGLYGPGTGTFLLLLFTGVCHLSLEDAAGATKAINLTTNVTSLFVFLLNGRAYLLLGFTAGICGMLGNYIGSSFFVKKRASFVKPLILIVLILFIGKIILEYI